MENIYDELETIRKINGGILDPADVVEYAKDPETKLHSRFEWDDTKASHAYRLWQARMVIRTTVTVMESTRKEIKAFVSLKEDRGVNGYRSTIDVMSDTDMRNRLLSQAKRDADIFRKRYESLSELEPIFRMMEAIFEYNIMKENELELEYV